MRILLAVLAVLSLSFCTCAEEAVTNHHKDGHQVPPPFQCDWFEHDQAHDCHPPKPPKNCNKCDEDCDCCKDEDDDASSSVDYSSSLVVILYPNMGIDTLPAFGAVVADLSPALNPKRVFKDAVSSAKLQLADAVARGMIPNKAKYVLLARWHGYTYSKKLIAKL